VEIYPWGVAEDEQDPFADIAANTAVLRELVGQTQGEITAEAYSSADDLLSTCFTFSE